MADLMCILWLAAQVKVELQTGHWCTLVLSSSLFLFSGGKSLSGPPLAFLLDLPLGWDRDVVSGPSHFSSTSSNVPEGSLLLEEPTPAAKALHLLTRRTVNALFGSLVLICLFLLLVFFLMDRAAFGGNGFCWVAVLPLFTTCTFWYKPVGSTVAPVAFSWEHTSQPFSAVLLSLIEDLRSPEDDNLWATSTFPSSSLWPHARPDSHFCSVSTATSVSLSRFTTSVFRAPLSSTDESFRSMWKENEVSLSSVFAVCSATGLVNCCVCCATSLELLWEQRPINVTGKYSSSDAGSDLTTLHL